MIDTEVSTDAKKRVVPNWFMPGTLFRLYRIAFRPVDAVRAHLVLFDYVVDVFFIVDFVLRSTYFALPAHGTVATDIASIRKHYIENGM
eukprot:scaffold298198_cov175-Cyclotella_meneghiniana.AAC.1